MPTSDQEKKTTGGCLCGEVRYEITGEPAFSGLCHCRDCMRATGAGHNAIAAYQKEQVSITGEYTEYSSLGNSGAEVTRCFCPKCGSRLFGKPASIPTLLMVTAGTLDNPEDFSPQALIFTRSRQKWHSYDENIPAFETVPPQRG